MDLTISRYYRTATVTEDRVRQSGYVIDVDGEEVAIIPGHAERRWPGLGDKVAERVAHFIAHEIGHE